MEKTIVKRQKRVRRKILALKVYPRFSVFRSHSHLYAQIIDDQKGETLVSLNTLKRKKYDPAEVGKEMALEALKKGIRKVVFDRGRYRYHGKIKALAQGAREGGLKF